MESVKTISSSVEINEYKLLNIRSLDFMYAFLKLVTFGYSGFHKYLEKAGYDFVDLGWFIDIYNQVEVIFKSPSRCKLHAIISHIWFHSRLSCFYFSEGFHFCNTKNSFGRLGKQAASSSIN